MTKILGPKDPKPYKLLNAGGAGGFLIIADHAGNKMPKSLGTLGLSTGDRKKHVSWDPGTAEIAALLAKKLNAPAIMSTYSRLVFDLNRGRTSPEAMRETYDGIAVPGNKKLSAAHKNARRREIFDAYHAAVEKQLMQMKKRKIAPFIIALHSFTPVMQGKKRPWQIGVLWDIDRKTAKKTIAAIKKQNPRLTVGDNKPYSLKSANVAENSLKRHAVRRHLPHVVVEFRQDLVATRRGAEKWADLFCRALLAALAHK